MLPSWKKMRAEADDGVTSADLRAVTAAAARPLSLALKAVFARTAPRPESASVFSKAAEDRR